MTNETIGNRVAFSRFNVDESCVAFLIIASDLGGRDLRRLRHGKSASVLWGRENEGARNEAVCVPCTLRGVEISIARSQDARCTPSILYL